MLDIGWSEFLVIGVVALVVVGPKELPVMFRTLGRFTAKARSMSREFTRAMEAAAKEAGVGDIAKDLKSVTSPRSLGLDAMQNAASRFEKWDPLKSSTLVKPAISKQSAGSAAEMAKAAKAPALAEIGPNTAALAAERTTKRASVIEAAQDRAAERAEAATPVVAKPAKAARIPKAQAEKPLIAAVAKAKAAPKPKPAAAVAAAKNAPRSTPKAAVVAGVPPAQPAKRARKAPAKTGDA